jgi:predicted Zn-dependent protease
LARAGQVASASHRLVLAAGSLPEPAGLQAERAALLLAAGVPEEAEAAAAQAVRLDPSAEAPRVLLARTRLALHRDAAALEALPRDGGREVWLVRGMALEQLGRHAQARAALERTARHGTLTPEAATWYALTGLTLQRVTQALAVLGPQAQAPGATPFTRGPRPRWRRPSASAAEAACPAIDGPEAAPPGRVTTRPGSAGRWRPPRGGAGRADPEPALSRWPSAPRPATPAGGRPPARAAGQAPLRRPGAGPLPGARASARRWLLSSAPGPPGRSNRSR